MNDKAHVGLVYAHAKGVGCNDDRHFARNPVVLTFLLFRRIESCMIVRGLDSFAHEAFGNISCALSTSYIHYGSSAFLRCDNLVDKIDHL